MYAVAGMNAEQIETRVLSMLGIASIGEKRA
jgi:1-deoxy-D-xylulose-5-phosphate synthase